jgi:hypothetical protein
MKPGKRQRRAELYERILTADPPVCARGNPVAVLNSCERRRRLLECWCRFDVNQIAADASTLRCPDLAASFDIAVDPEDVEAIAADIELCLERSLPADEGERDALERLTRVRQRLDVLTEHGAGLTDEYSDAVTP